MTERIGLVASVCLVAATLAIHWLAPDHGTLTFVVAGLAIVPLAGQIGRATEDLAERLGSGVGGLLNATFGNAAELILSGFALQRGLTDLVKASITGSIIANVLLVFGAAALAGGSRKPIVSFNRTAAGVGTTMLVLSVIALAVPAMFHHLTPGDRSGLELWLDTEIAVVLLITYIFYLWFTLGTHRQLYAAPGAGSERPRRRTPTRNALVRLAAATIAVAVVSEILVGVIDEGSRAIGASQVFVGLVIVAIIGNAAEHYSAVMFGWRDKMDTALQIAVGSSIQMALFVAPILVFLSFAIAPRPMNLLFTTYELAALAVSVLIIASVAHDGETHWMEGVQLLAVYLILALGFYFLPVRS
jgi:Ca2+:H+ antiporter